MLPPAPGMFSTVTGTFQASLSFCANMRPVMSVALPGVKPTIMRIARSGYVCALAWPEANSANAKKQMRMTFIMAASPPPSS